MRCPIIELIANDFDNKFEIFRNVFLYFLPIGSVIYCLFICFLIVFERDKTIKNEKKIKIINSKATRSVSYDFQNPLFYIKNDNNKLPTISKFRKTKYKFKKEQHGLLKR